MSKPAKFKKYFPIVENRYDDFVALHVNQTEQCTSFTELWTIENVAK